MSDNEFLRKVFLFKDLSDKELSEFSSILKEVTFEKNEAVITEEKSGDSLYIIKAGAVHITKTIDTKPRLLARLGVGDFFGEICLFDLGLRTADARTIQPSTLLELQKATFDHLIEQHPGIGVKVLYAMMQEMAKRLRNTDEMMKNLVLWIMSTKEWEKLP